MFKRRTVTGLADMICGNPEAGPFFVYRSSVCLTEFLQDVGTRDVHDSSTRRWWVAGVLEELLKPP